MANNPYVNKVELADGTPVMDISDTTADASDVYEGKYFYTASGAKTAGTAPTGLTLLSYGSSTWDDFIAAYQANRIVYCRASSNSNPASGSQNRLAFMAYVNDATNPTNVEFQYYRSVNQHSATQQGDQVYVYKLDKTAGWTVTVREAYTKIVAGTNMGSSYSSGALTLNFTGTIPSTASDVGAVAANQGSANSGKILGVGSDGAVAPVDAPHELPSSGSRYYVLQKNSTTNYDVKWGQVNLSALAYGGASTGSFLRYGYNSWQAENSLLTHCGEVVYEDDGQGNTVSYATFDPNWIIGFDCFAVIFDYGPDDGEGGSIYGDISHELRLMYYYDHPQDNDGNPTQRDFYFYDPYYSTTLSYRKIRKFVATFDLNYWSWGLPYEVLADDYNPIMSPESPTSGQYLMYNGTTWVAASGGGGIPAPSNPATGAFLVYNGSAWVAQTLSTWQGGNY